MKRLHLEALRSKNHNKTKLTILDTHTNTIYKNNKKFTYARAFYIYVHFISCFTKQ